MTITLTQAQGKVPVTVMSIQGEIDASNYLDVIEHAKEAYKAGMRNLLLDMSQVPYISSSGLVALHSIALLMRGGAPSDTEHGWNALHAIDRDSESGRQEHIKLLNLQSGVERTLNMTGLKEFFETHTDLETAVASFG